MNLKEQCPKSEGDKNSLLDIATTYIAPVDNAKLTGSFIDKINQSSVLSDDLISNLNSYKNVLFIIDTNINLSLFTDILSLATSNNYKIIIASYGNKNITLDDYKTIFPNDLYDRYVNSFITYDLADLTDYDFFGTTRYKSAIMLHKSFLTAELIIPIANIEYDILYGFTGGKSMIFNGIAPKKSTDKFADFIIDEQYKMPNQSYNLNNLADNIISDNSSAGVLIARSDVTYFAINYITDADGDITDINAGDIFISHIEMTKIFHERYSYKLDHNQLKFDAVIIKLNCKSLEESLRSIYATTSITDKGCRIIIDATEINQIGSSKFISSLYMNDRADMINELKNHFDIDIYLAFILKYLTATYYIAILSDLDKDILRMAGLNNLTDVNSVNEILANAKSKAGIYYAYRFATR